MKLLRRGLILIGALTLLGMFFRPAAADSIVLRDGQHVQGKFAGGTQGVIAFSTAGGTQYYNVADVLVMTFESDSDTPGIHVVPDSSKSDSMLQPQKGDLKTRNPTVKSTRKSQLQPKPPALLLLAAKRTK